MQKAIVESLDSETRPTSSRRWIPTRLPTCSADLPEDRTEQILIQMEPEAQQDVVELLEHREETAAGRMTTEFLAFRCRRRYRMRSIPCASSKAASRRSARSTWWILTGPWSAPSPCENRARATSSPMLSLAQEPLVLAHEGVEENKVAELFDKYNLQTLPVVDEQNKLTGVITSDDVISMLRAKL